MLLRRKIQKPHCRCSFDWAATSQAESRVAAIAGHCRCAIQSTGVKRIWKVDRALRRSMSENAGTIAEERSIHQRGRGPSCDWFLDTPRHGQTSVIFQKRIQPDQADRRRMAE